MKRSDFYYDLPDELIARYPADHRTLSKLMAVNSQSMDIQHLVFHQLGSLLNAGDLLVLNHTKVIPARLFARKNTGGKVELLLERVVDETTFLAQIKSSKPCKMNDVLFLSNAETLRITGKSDRFYEVVRGSTQPIVEWFCLLGEIPLPPYMNRSAEALDYERYQTVYAKHLGSVAAPTAGLHFDEALLSSLSEQGIQVGYVNLQVGAGTFLPVREDDIRMHKMHSERYVIEQELVEKIQKTKASGHRVIAVGTTSLRALESAALSTGQVEAKSEETSIFIYPGFEFKVVDALITNFHLPESTLLMLLSAFMGHDRMHHVYQEAVKNRYRFFSYGDAMWVNRY